MWVVAACVGSPGRKERKQAVNERVCRDGHRIRHPQPSPSQAHSGGEYDWFDRLRNRLNCQFPLLNLNVPSGQLGAVTFPVMTVAFNFESVVGFSPSNVTKGPFPDKDKLT